MLAAARLSPPTPLSPPGPRRAAVWCVLFVGISDKHKLEPVHAGQD